MARRKPQSGGKPRRSTPYAGSVHQNPVRRQRRRRSTMSRMSTRSATLLILGTAVAAIAGVAVAGAITNGGAKNTASNTPSAPPVSSPTPSPNPSGPLGPVAPTPVSTHSSPPVVHTPSPKPSPTPVLTPSLSPSAAPSPTPKTSATKQSCPTSPAARAAVARRLLQHTSALPNATLITDGPRQGLLGASDLSARTVTLFVRSCADEPTIQLAFVWGYEAGQFIPIQNWSSSTTSRYAQLRGMSGTPSQTLLRQDVASVYAFWQTGSTRYWQSPISAPSASQLQSLVPYLKTS